MSDEGKHTTLKEEARILCARLIPHTTSVQNVDLIAQALRLARKGALAEAEKMAFINHDWDGAMISGAIRAMKEQT